MTQATSVVEDAPIVVQVKRVTSILLDTRVARDSFSTPGGQLGPCSPGLQRGLQVSLMSQLSGRHYAPETVQRNLEDREQEDRENETDHGSTVCHGKCSAPRHQGQWQQWKPRHQVFSTQHPLNPSICMGGFADERNLRVSETG